MNMSKINEKTSTLVPAATPNINEARSRDRRIINSTVDNNNTVDSSSLTVEEYKPENCQVSYAIRFHLKSGKERDMFIDEEDADGNRNEFYNARSIFYKVQRTLDQYGNYSSKNDDITSQNFIVFKDTVEFMELIER